MPVLQGADVADLLIEQPAYQLALFPVAGDGVDDLVEVQVGDESAICLVLAPRPALFGPGTAGWLMPWADFGGRDSGSMAAQLRAWPDGVPAPSPVLTR